MKRKILIGLGVFAVIIVSSISIAFTLTSGLPKLANQMFDLVAQGKIEEAYITTTSNGFQQITTLEEFQFFVENSGLNLYVSSTWNYREILGSQGHIEGTVALSNGTTLPMEVDFVKENGEWKIFGVGIKEVGTDLGNDEAGEIPDEETRIALANETMAYFADAVSSRDFAAFYDYVGNVWKVQTTAEEIETAFAGFFQEGFDFEYTKSMNPTFTAEPYFNEYSALVLTGNYTNDSYQTDFTFEYFLEDGAYKLVSIEVYSEALDDVGQPTGVPSSVPPVNPVP